MGCQGCVILHLTCVMGVIKGQYVHLTSHVQYGLMVLFCTLGGVYEICALVSSFLRFGYFLNPTNGLSLKVLAQSLLCSIMFQFEWTNFFMFFFTCFSLFFVFVSLPVIHPV